MALYTKYRVEYYQRPSDEWKCPITQVSPTLGNIYMLNCGHSFSNAIAQCATLINSISTLRCPICRRTMTSKDKDLSKSINLAKNYSLMAIMSAKVLKRVQSTQTSATNVRELRVTTIQDTNRSIQKRTTRKTNLRLVRKFKTLKKEHEELKRDNKELKQENEELKQENEDLMTNLANNEYMQSRGWLGIT